MACKKNLARCPVCMNYMDEEKKCALAPEDQRFQPRKVSRRTHLKRVKTELAESQSIIDSYETMDAAIQGNPEGIAKLSAALKLAVQNKKAGPCVGCPGHYCNKCSKNLYNQVMKPKKQLGDYYGKQKLEENRPVHS